MRKSQTFYGNKIKFREKKVMNLLERNKISMWITSWNYEGQNLLFLLGGVNLMKKIVQLQGKRTKFCENNLMMM